MAGGYYDSAKQLLARLLATHERTLGPDHPNTCRAALALASFYRFRSQKYKALPLAAKALKGYTKTLGLGHQETIRAKKLIESLKNK